MLTRTARITHSVALLIAASALAGCASVQTTSEYARANNWQAMEVDGSQRFCRREQSQDASSPGAGVKCITRRELLALKGTDEFAIAHGYRPTVIRQTQYYCRGQQVQAASSEPRGADCLTRAQIRTEVAAAAVLSAANTNSPPDYSVGVNPPPTMIVPTAQGPGPNPYPK